jgi:hypothetical protein
VRNTSNAKRMTTAEVYRRLRSIKRVLLNKNQALLYNKEIICLDMGLLADREIQSEDFYLRPVSFNDALFLKTIADNKELFDKSNFTHQELMQYVRSNQKTICQSFAITAMLFTVYRKQQVIKKHVIICTGSIYHAPRIFYRDESSKRVVYERVIDYSDLY